MFETLAELTAEWILPTVFFWLILCLLATSFEEWIATRMADHERFLADAVHDMLGDEELCKKFYKSPLIKVKTPSQSMPPGMKVPGWMQGFFKTRERRPDYIDPRLFAQVILSWVVDGEKSDSQRPKPATPATIHENVRRLRSTHEHLAEILETMLSEFRQKGTSYHETFVGLQASLERWFNAVMEQTSRRYRRLAIWRLLSIGFILSILVNFDPVFLTTQLWNSSAVETGASTLPVGWKSTPFSEVDSCELVPGSGQQFGIPLPMSPFRDCITPFSPSEDMNVLWKVTGLFVGGFLIRIGSPYVQDLLKSKAAPKPS